jgi:predicted Zn-dependent protease
MINTFSLKFKSTLLATALTVSLLPAASSVAQDKNKLPEIGTAAVSTLSIDKERIYGDAMMRNTRATQPIIQDPVLIEYINDLGNRLVKNAHGVNYSFSFFLVNNKELNAYAFFGGHVGVHSGLVVRSENESELASVLGHEISHVTLRHLARRMEDQSRNTPLSTAGMISGILLALVNPQAGMAALSATMAATQQAGINYTRGNEEEADRIGIALLADSGFDPHAAPSFFAKMAADYRYHSKPPAMLLTHPMPESRIADARGRAQRYPARPQVVSEAFELSKARLRARYFGNSHDNIIQFQSELDKKNYRIKSAVQYGLALSYLEDEQFDKAEAIILKLQQNDSKNLFYADALSDIYIAKKNFKPALTMLSELALLMPNNQVITLNYANVAMEAGQYELAIQLLQDFLILNPGHYIAYDLLTQVYKKQDNLLQMHTNKAEKLALLGAYPQAVDQLQTAYNFAKEQPLMQKRIKARILQFKDAEERLKQLIGK